MKIKGKKVRVDACLRDLIRALNNKGIVTLGSCCGHEKYPITIVYRHKSNDFMDGNIYEFCTGWGIIGRKKKFYKQDDEGFFFIPELIENKVKL